ncbi:MAG TPA: LacI family DNA-binding transcriptional regulator [Propionibacteriaceae bacterium]|nr:LacI family DNA-binding transcriptional regulator [Propionibacteriaceae bacterium]
MDMTTIAAPRRRRGPAPVGGANIRDVARHAGVSVATVSRVLAGGDNVSQKTRDRVRASMEQLDFVINGHARALGGRGTPLVALVLDDVFGPSFAALARGVEHGATERSHLLVMSTTHNSPDRELEIVNMLQEQRPAAVLWLGPLYDRPADEERVVSYAETLRVVGAPLVVCARGPLPSAPQISSVGYDNEAGARAITRHLIELGHREILFAGADPTHHASRRRLAGHLSAMEEAGLPTPDALHPPGDFNAGSGRQAVMEALSAGTRFTALVGVVDAVALSARQALQERGLRVPDDVSVTGFDDIDPLPGLDLGLTSVRVPFEEVGRRALSLALDRAAGEHVVLPVDVTVRGSTRPVDTVGSGVVGEA